jgi:hypothetical protein
MERTKPWISSGNFEHVCDQNPFEIFFEIDWYKSIKRGLSTLWGRERAQPGNQILGGNHQLYNVLITVHVFLMIWTSHMQGNLHVWF